MNAHSQYGEDFELYGLSVLQSGDKTESETHWAGCYEFRTKLEIPPDRVVARISLILSKIVQSI
jgi:hypothetical protein